MKKQRHHYVWQKYLAPWVAEGRICCLRAGRIFPVGTKNIAVETGFYKVKRLSGEELAFVRKLADASASETAKRTNHTWIDNHTVIYEFQDFANAEGASSIELEKLIETNAFNLEEDMQMHIENSGVRYLDSMLNNDISFYYEDDQCVEFLFYLATQFVRTKKMRDIIQSAGAQVGISDMSNCWPVVSHIFATNFGWTMYAERDKYELHILHNHTELNIITADQPLINVHPLGSDADHEICLYYPLSPNMAMIYSPIDRSNSKAEEYIKKAEVAKYNNEIYGASNEQVFALNDSDLQSYIR